MKRFAAVSCFVLAMCSVAQADCQCQGKQLIRYKGGDSAPLSWNYQAYEVTAGRADSPRLICFQRTVTNASQLAVTNIRWDVAAFRRRLIPAQKTNSSCPTIPAEISVSPMQGPLYHGVSSEHYDTTVNPPPDGWKQAAASPSDWPLIRSAFQVSVSEDRWAEIAIYSSASTTDNKLTELRYEIESRGNVYVGVLLNLPVAQRMQKDLPFTTSSFAVSPKFVEGPVSVQTATAVIWNVDTKEGLAVDIVGAYAPVEGKRSYSDEELYKRVQ
jgi:hypothetical protein